MLLTLSSWQMDARTLATEMAPILIWQRGQSPHQYDQFWNHSAKSSKKYMDSNSNSSAWEMLEGLFLFIPFCFQVGSVIFHSSLIIFNTNHIK